MLASLVFAIASTHAGITCEIKAARLPVVLKQLSELSHTELAVSQPMEDTILLVSIHDMPQEKLLERIADATCGKWTPIRSGFKLMPDTKRAEAEEKARIEKLAVAIAKAQEKFAASIKTEPFTVPRAQLLLEQLKQYDELEQANNNVDRQRGFQLFQTLKKDIPADRALNKIVAMIDPKLLAALPRGSSALSDKPTRMEYPLPASVRTVFDDLVKDTNTWLSVFKGDPAFDGRTTRLAADPRWVRAPIDASKLRVFVHATKYNRWDTPNFSVRFVDENNSIVAFGEVGLPGITPATPEIKKPQQNLTPLTLSEDANRQLDALMTERKYGDPGVDREVKKQLLDPVKFEPLSYVASEVILQAAKAENLDVVASLPDVALGFNHVFTKWTPPEKRTVGNIWRILYGQYETKTEDGCLTISPKDRVKPVNRQALGVLLRSVDAEGILRLEPAADFAAGEDFDNPPYEVYLPMDALVPGANSAAGLTWGSELRFYGLLTAEQRKRLKEHGTMLIRELSPSASAQLQRVVYNEHRAFNILFMPKGHSKGGGGPSLNQEPPESMPNGLDPNSQFGMTLTRSRGVIGNGDGALGQAPTLPMELRSLAAHQLAPVLPQARSYDPMRDQTLLTVLPGYRSTLIIEFGFTPEITGRMFLLDSEFNLREKSMSMDALPDDYKKDLEFHIADLKRMFGGG